MKEIFSTRTKELTEVYARALVKAQQTGKLEDIVSATFALNTIQCSLDCAEKRLAIDITNVDTNFIDLVTMLNQVRSPEQMDDYYRERGNIIERMVSHVYRNPRLLMEHLDQISSLTLLGVTSPGAVITLINLSEVYMRASLLLLGPFSYILSVDSQGKIYPKKLPLIGRPEKLAEEFQNITFHSVTTHLFDPENLAKIVKDHESWSNFTHDENYPRIQNAPNIATQLLTFAQQHKEYYRPWPHEVVINNPPLYSITVMDEAPEGLLYKIKHTDGSITLGRILFIEDKYAIVQSDGVGQPAKWNSNPKNTISIFALVSAIVRDMFVLEAKERFYDESRPLKSSFGKKKKKKEEYVWLPRTRINYIGERETPLDERVDRIAPYNIAPHPVGGHPRRAKNPSPKQLELAKSVGMEIPAGYTYVKDYERSGGKGERRLYKSRSALMTLFGAA